MSINFKNLPDPMPGKIPEGLYWATITKAETTMAQDGTEELVLQYTFECEGKPRKLTDRMKELQTAPWPQKLSRFANATGLTQIEGDVSFKDVAKILQGKALGLHLNYYTSKTNNNEYLQVNIFGPYGGYITEEDFKKYQPEAITTVAPAAADDNAFDPGEPSPDDPF